MQGRSLYEIAHKIEYLDCVIKEAQRLNPPVAFVNRECDEDYDIDGIHITEGTEVQIPIYALHRDPNAWEDPEKFYPRDSEAPLKIPSTPSSSCPSVLDQGIVSG